jgi:hypothetical protein
VVKEIGTSQQTILTKDDFTPRSKQTEEGWQKPKAKSPPSNKMPKNTCSQQRRLQRPQRSLKLQTVFQVFIELTRGPHAKDPQRN